MTEVVPLEVIVNEPEFKVPVLNVTLFLPKSTVIGVVASPILRVAEVEATPLLESNTVSPATCWALKANGTAAI